MPTSTVSPLYLKLIRRFPLRPIRSDEELDRATAIALELDSRSDLTGEERDYLDVLATLIGRFEDEHHPIPDVSGPDMLRTLIEIRGLSQVEVARATGISEPALSEMIRGKRPLGRKTIEALAGYFRVDPGLFLASGSGTRP